MKTFDTAIAFLARYTRLIAMRVPPEHAIGLSKAAGSYSIREAERALSDEDWLHARAYRAEAVFPFEAIGWRDTGQSRLTENTSLPFKPVLRWPVKTVDELFEEMNAAFKERVRSGVIYSTNP